MIPFALGFLKHKIFTRSGKYVQKCIVTTTRFLEVEITMQVHARPAAEIRSYSELNTWMNFDNVN